MSNGLGNNTFSVIGAYWVSFAVYFSTPMARFCKRTVAANYKQLAQMKMLTWCTLKKQRY